MEDPVVSRFLVFFGPHSPAGRSSNFHSQTPAILTAFPILLSPFCDRASPGDSFFSEICPTPRRLAQYPFSALDSDAMIELAFFEASVKSEWKRVSLLFVFQGNPRRSRSGVVPSFRRIMPSRDSGRAVAFSRFFR